MKHSGSVKETSVGTVDYQSSAGRRTQEKSVHVIHQQHHQQPAATGGQILAHAADAVSSTLHSAKQGLADAK
uniref:Uncharacterized protein n=1 Tax=Kalanchoe fedtschenkoi TaxID=63787 RepID=A0A7N0TNP6_KALFE